MNKVLVALLILVLPNMKAADGAYQFTLHQPATLNGTLLKTGDYRLVVDGDKGRIKVGKTVVEAPLKIETGEHKFKDTLVNFDTSTTGLRISEIDIGGSTKRIVFGANTSGQ